MSATPYRRYPQPDGSVIHAASPEDAAKLAHTPGPWSIVHHLTVTDSDGEVITEASVSPGEESAFANARLIAAAPELLAELKHARDALQWYAEDSRNAVAQEAIRNIDSAIAKAEGRA